MTEALVRMSFTIKCSFNLIINSKYGGGVGVFFVVNLDYFQTSKQATVWNVLTGESKVYQQQIRKFPTITHFWLVGVPAN